MGEDSRWSFRREICIGLDCRHSGQENNLISLLNDILYISKFVQNLFSEIRVFPRTVLFIVLDFHLRELCNALKLQRI